MKTVKLTPIAAIHARIALEAYMVGLDKQLKKAEDKDPNGLEAFRLKADRAELVALHDELSR